MPGRGGSANGKLMDVEVLKEYWSRGSIWTFGDDDEIEIDVTCTVPEEVARMVKEFVERRENEGRTWTDWADEPDYGS